MRYSARFVSPFVLKIIENLKARNKIQLQANAVDA